MKKLAYYLLLTVLLMACTTVDKDIPEAESTQWILIDNFEKSDSMNQWILRDTKNETEPYIENAQVTEIRSEDGNKNSYLIKKPAADGIVGNRKALSYLKLPVSIDVGEIVTIYTRINVQAFPNNHVFGLSNLNPEGIDKQDYNAFEPTLRVTDKSESNGYKNDGTLLVRQNDEYKKIVNSLAKRPASPMAINTWYELWYVVNNAKVAEGGQKYDLYIRGGEFPNQQKVFSDADFRMKRELPLTYFLANCNTGPIKHPYGNGGLRFDDLFMAKGVLLTDPVNDYQN